MSRSYRKGFQCCGDKEFKKIYNRRNRRTDILDDIDHRPSSYKKLNCPWNISDYRSDISWEQWKEWNSPYYDSEEELWASWQRYRTK